MPSRKRRSGRLSMRRGLFEDVGENKRARKFPDPWLEFDPRFSDDNHDVM